MSGPTRYRIYRSGAVREQFIDAVRAARAAGRGDESVAAADVVERGLTWLADELGESRFPLKVLGECRCVTVLPLTVWYTVHVARREVQVFRYWYVSRR